MPTNIIAELHAAKSMLSLSTSAYHSVVRILYEDLLQYTEWVSFYSGMHNV